MSYSFLSPAGQLVLFHCLKSANAAISSLLHDDWQDAFNVPNVFALTTSERFALLEDACAEGLAEIVDAGGVAVHRFVDPLESGLSQFRIRLTGFGGKALAKQFGADLNLCVESIEPTDVGGILQLEFLAASAKAARVVQDALNAHVARQAIQLIEVMDVSEVFLPYWEKRVQGYRVSAKTSWKIGSSAIWLSEQQFLDCNSELSSSIDDFCSLWDVEPRRMFGDRSSYQ
jgi:hypothetical protein